MTVSPLLLLISILGLTFLFGFASGYWVRAFISRRRRKGYRERFYEQR